MAQTKKTPIEFSEARLKELSEPITIGVEKNINGKRSPIPLPVKPGEGSSGTGFSHQDVRELGQWLARDWTGGGLYFLKAVGDNGQEMRWEWFYPPSQFPERPPPTMQGANSPAPTTVSPSGSWLMTSAAQYPWAPPASPTPHPGAYFNTPLAGVPPFGSPHLGAPSSPWAPATSDARVTKLEAQVQRERQEAAHRAEMSRLTQEFRELQNRLGSQSREGESSTVRELKEHIARLEASQREDKISHQIAAMQQQTAEMIKGIAQSTQEQIRAMQDQTRQIMEETRRMADEAKRSAPDPTLTMIIENQKASAAAGAEAARISADAQKEIARLQAESQRDAAKNAIGPAQVIDLISKMTSGHEHMDKAWTIMERGVDMFLQAQGPPVHPALQMLGEGIQGALSTAQQYLQQKEHASIAQARAQQAQAMAQAQQSQANAAGRAAQLAEAPAVTEAMHAQQAADDAEAQVQAQEVEIFGAALESIRRLRQGVETKQLTSEQAAHAIFQGIEYFAQREQAGQGTAPPVFDLWKEGDVARMIETILPDATTSFQEQTIAALFEIVEKLKQQAAQAAKSAPKNGKSTTVDAENSVEGADDEGAQDGRELRPI